MGSGILVLIATLQPIIIRNSVASIAMSTIKQIWTTNIRVNKVTPGPAPHVIIAIRKVQTENDRKNIFRLD